MVMCYVVAVGLCAAAFGDRPEPPSGFKATSDEEKVALAWQKSPTPGVDSHRIYRADMNGKGKALLAEVRVKDDAKEFTFEDRSGDQGYRYLYWLTAYNSTEDLSNRESAEAGPLLAGPPQVLITYATADESVYQARPDYRYGHTYPDLGGLNTYMGGLFAGLRPEAGKEARFYLRFDISSIPSSHTITNAYMRVYCNRIIDFVSDGHGGYDQVPDWDERWAFLCVYHCDPGGTWPTAPATFEDTISWNDVPAQCTTCPLFGGGPDYVWIGTNYYPFNTLGRIKAEAWTYSRHDSAQFPGGNYLSDAVHHTSFNGQGKRLFTVRVVMYNESAWYYFDEKEWDNSLRAVLYVYHYLP
jgi:hypothetical protein